MIGVRTRLAWLKGCSTSLAFVAFAQGSAAYAAERTYRFDIPAQELGTALKTFAQVARQQISFDAASVQGKRSPALQGDYTARAALDVLLVGSGLRADNGRSGIFIVRPAVVDAASAEAAASNQAVASSSSDIIVTAQKREQKIQDVPIAISAFSGKTLDAMKIETGADLLKSIPNVTFSKNNFAGYNFSIRGIGTKAVAASTDPGVAVAFNSSNLIVNRLFEQEFFDIERVEVLRGPQGTLYGRNATAGVVNIISNKANLAKTEGFLKLETGSFSTKRVSGALNMPIIEDRLALRVAGAYTKRDGFAVNDFYDKRIDGRDLFSTRTTITAKPIDPLRIDLIWEHFNENDDRQRTGKQLCHKDNGPTSIGGQVLTFDNPVSPRYQPQFSQGCKDGSLYDDGAYSTPNGLSLNAYEALATLGGGLLRDPNTGGPVDPYGGVQQSRDLRHYSAVINPRYKTRADILESNVTLDLGKVSLISQTAYDGDRYYSTQDYSRYVSVPIFDNVAPSPDTPNLLATPDGIFKDPQLGASDRFLSGDLVRTNSRQFSQEVRLQSNDPTSRLQYVVGGNYTNFRYDADYFVFINTLTGLTQYSGSLFSLAQLSTCGAKVPGGLTAPGQYVPGCIYTDPNAIGVGPADGHNYFRSVNPYHLTSWGAFADANYALTPQLKIIAGARLNIDHKRFDQVPSQLLLGTGSLGFDLFNNPSLAGFVDRGYPKVGEIKQSWTKPTGRAGLQWTPDLSFTNKTMIYATYSRGYKAGGANPPGPGFGTAEGGYNAGGAFARGQTLTATFKPEYVNSYELGIKNTVLDGKVTFDATGFYYDYKGYQVSQIIDRSSQNENFDATIWGLEFETVVNPTRNIAINANLGYERSRIDKGERSIDVLNRTQGREGYYVVKPFVQLPSNCVASEAVILKNIDNEGSPLGYAICQGSGLSDIRLADPANYAPGTTLEDLFPNGGRGFFADLSHNELPNTPHLTFNIGAQYTLPLAKDWGLIGRVDFYHQSSSYARVYNDANDRLHGWENLNLSLRLGNERLKLLAEFYVKNVLDSTPITDAFINSDDTGLTTNVFTLDPRIFGVNITKGF